MATKPLVSISILNWNGIENTKECLKSVRKLTYPNIEIIVVDNGSHPDEKAYLSSLTDITYIDLPKNLGFTGGHIEAEKRANGEFIALLNNDLVSDPMWVDACLETFGRHPKAAFVGGKTFKWNSDNPAFNVANEFYTFQEVDPKSGNTRTLLVGDEERVVDSISGAALMIRRSVIKEIGFLDDIFFAYYEETDLIARAMRAGYEAYYNPSALTWHKIGQSSSGGESGSFYLYQMHRNRYLFAAKNFDSKYWRHFRRRYAAEIARMALLFTFRHDAEARQRLRAFRWIALHQNLIAARRRAAQVLGSSYIEHLASYRPNDVSVVIPCYNYGAYVGPAIDSVLAQTHLPKKIFVINDGSTDDSRATIDSFRHNALIEIHHRSNGGVVAAKNFGLSLVRTHWTIFLDADDLLDKEYIELTLKRANDDMLDIVYTDMQLFGAQKDIFHAPPFNALTLLHRNYINNSALLKTTLIKQVKGYKQEMHDGLEDWELYISMIEAGARPGHLPGALMKYRQHEAALSRNAAVEHKELILYQRLISLHPTTFRHMTPLRRRFLRLGIFSYQLLRYPGVWLIILKSSRRALLAGVRVVMHEARSYFAYKDLQ